MADRFTQMNACVQSRALRMILLAAALMFLAGCEAIPMPDLSQVGLVKTRTMVTVKAGYSSVNIRPTPSTAQTPIATVRGGDQLIFREAYGDWLGIRFYDTTGDERDGWIYKYLVDGYEKPETVATPSTRSSHAEPLNNVAPAPVPVEPAQDGLPKSDTVSPL